MARLSSVVLLIAMLMFGLGVAHANVTFDYIGSPYSYSYDEEGALGAVVPGLGDRIIASVTFTDDLLNYWDTDAPFSTSWGDLYGLWVSATLSAGDLTRSAADPGAFFVMTFSEGNLRDWGLDYATDSLKLHSVWQRDDGLLWGEDEAGNSSGSINVSDVAGAWTMRTDAIPEPLCLFLLAPGFIGLAGFKKRLG